MSDQVEIIKFDNEKQQVFGWAYVTHDEEGQVVVDKSGEFVDSHDELEDAAYKFVLHSRQGGVEHQRDDKGVIAKSTLIESVVFTPEKKQALGIPEGTIPDGWWVGWTIHDDEVWNQIRKGELTSFSVHGSGTKTTIDH